MTWPSFEAAFCAAVAVRLGWAVGGIIVWCAAWVWARLTGSSK